MKKNILAVLVGCALVLALFSVAEIFYRVTKRKAKVSIQYPLPPLAATSPEGEVSAQFIAELKNGPFAAWTSRLPRTDLAIKYTEGVHRTGLSLGCVMCPEMLPPARYAHKSVSNISRKLIYEINVTIDSLHRRITPLSSQAEKAIVMFGDSYTFGEAVEDNETSPYILGQLRPDTQVLNLGMSGSGPGEFLYEVSEKPWGRLADLKQKKKIFIFTMMDDHLERLICRSPCMAEDRQWTRLKKPYYANVQGVPQFRGDFEERKILNLFYSWIESSVFLKYHHVAVPPFFTQKDFNFFAAVMSEAQKHLQANFPGSEFYVVFFPTKSRPYAAVLSKACKEHGLKVLNYDSIDTYTLTNKRDHVIGDGHPSPLTHYIFAKLLDRDLPR